MITGVGEAFLDQTVRYHCPVFVVFRFSKYKQPCFKRKIWKYESGDYDLLNQLIYLNAKETQPFSIHFFFHMDQIRLIS